MTGEAEQTRDDERDEPTRAYEFSEPWKTWRSGIVYAHTAKDAKQRVHDGEGETADLIAYARPMRDVQIKRLPREDRHP